MKNIQEFHCKIGDKNYRIFTNNHLQLKRILKILMNLSKNLLKNNMKERKKSKKKLSMLKMTTILIL